MQTTDNLDYLLSQGFSTTILERFWGKVNKTNNCWLWTATCSRERGMICKGTGPMVFSSRVSWMIHFGPIPNGIEVLHQCDNPKCVRPDHLFLGTQIENVKDMMAKGRQAKGQRKGLAKLTDAQVLEIRRIGRSILQRELGQRFGVHPTVICEILSRKVWKHI